jgi:hypothetical protein
LLLKIIKPLTPDPSPTRGEGSHCPYPTRGEGRERGLKQINGQAVGSREKSLPTWGAWIETKKCANVTKDQEVATYPGSVD